MVELNFYISDEDMERLFLIKDIQGKHSLTGNDFARELLERELYRLFRLPHALTKRGSLLTRMLTGDKTRSQRGARGLSSYRHGRPRKPGLNSSIVLKLLLADNETMKPDTHK